MLTMLERQQKTEPLPQKDVEAMIKLVDPLTELSDKLPSELARYRLESQRVAEALTTPIEDLDRRLRELVMPRQHWHLAKC